jgi:hypothetical protein
MTVTTGMQLLNLVEKADAIFKDSFDKAGKLSQVDKGVAKRQVKSGLKDGGGKEDDVLELKKVTLPASSLKPSQRTMVLGKALGMAIGVIRGKMDVKELDAIISKDNHIMDGHHRWAAAIIAGGKSAKVSGWKADENAEDLVRVLNVVSKGKLGVNTGKKGKGKLSEFTSAKAKKMLEDFVENGISGDHPVDAKVVAKALDDKYGSVFDGIKTMSSNIRLISKDVPSWAPNRIDMPVVDEKDIGTVKAMLKKGTVDWEEPYAESMSVMIGRIVESKPCCESCGELHEGMNVVQNIKTILPKGRAGVVDLVNFTLGSLLDVDGAGPDWVPNIRDAEKLRKWAVRDFLETGDFGGLLADADIDITGVKSAGGRDSFETGDFMDQSRDPQRHEPGDSVEYAPKVLMEISAEIDPKAYLMMIARKGGIPRARIMEAMKEEDLRERLSKMAASKLILELARPEWARTFGDILDNGHEDVERVLDDSLPSQWKGSVDFDHSFAVSTSAPEIRTVKYGFRGKKLVVEVVLAATVGMGDGASIDWKNFEDMNLDPPDSERYGKGVIPWPS